MHQLRARWNDYKANIHASQLTAIPSLLTKRLLVLYLIVLCPSANANAAVITNREKRKTKMSSELIHRNQTKDQSENQITDSSSSPRRESSHSKTRNMLNRAPFLFIGIAIATLFFHYLPSRFTLPQHSNTDSSLIETDLALPTRRVLLEERRTLQERRQRVPLSVGLKNKKNKRVLVTGGAGFVGSHLVDRLIERGDNVIVIDNYFTGRKENVIHHIGDPNFELIRHDVVEPILLEVDQIYHLACPASPVHYKFNPVKTIISFFIIYLFTTFQCSL